MAGFGDNGLRRLANEASDLGRRPGHQRDKVWKGSTSETMMDAKTKAERASGGSKHCNYSKIRELVYDRVQAEGAGSSARGAGVAAEQSQEGPDRKRRKEQQDGGGASQHISDLCAVPRQRCSCILVKNVPARFLNWPDIEREFSQYGRVRRVVVEERERWMVVEFNNANVAVRCVSVKQSFFENRFVEVAQFAPGCDEVIRQCNGSVKQYFGEPALNELYALRQSVQSKEDELRQYRQTLPELKALLLQNGGVRVQELEQIAEDIRSKHALIDELLSLRTQMTNLEHGLDAIKK